MHAFAGLAVVVWVLFACMHPLRSIGYMVRLAWGGLLIGCFIAIVVIGLREIGFATGVMHPIHTASQSYNPAFEHRLKN